jgi:streptogramin lyase
MARERLRTSFYIAMRYVDGQDLAKLIDEGPLPLERTASIMRQVAGALDAAHERGLVHRDVKPGNILVGSGDHAYLTDFGLIKRRESTTRFTKTGQFMGSVHYAAPEQIKGEDVDHRADVYSLGCAMYECLVGEPPFVGESEAAVLYAHLNEAPPKVSERRPDLPDGLDVVISRCMAKDAGERFSTAGAVRSELYGLTERRHRPEAREQGKRRATTVGLMAGLMGTAVIVVLLALGITHGGRAPASRRDAAGKHGRISLAQGLVALDPTSHSLSHQVSGLGGSRSLVSAGEGAIWTTRSFPVVKIDPRGRGSHQVNLGFPVVAFAFSSGAVWAQGGDLGSGTGQLARIDPATLNFRVIRVHVGSLRPTTTGVAYVRGHVWVSAAEGFLIPVDVGSNHVGKASQVAPSADSVVAGGGDLWVLDRFDSKVIRYDPIRRRTVNAFSLQGNIDDIAFGLGSAWVLDSLSGTVTRIDASTGSVTGPRRVGSGASDITTGFGAVWVANRDDGSISRMDPLTMDSSEIVIGSAPAAITADPSSHRLWIVVSQRKTTND